MQSEAPSTSAAAAAAAQIETAAEDVQQAEQPSQAQRLASALKGSKAEGKGIVYSKVSIFHCDSFWLGLSYVSSSCFKSSGVCLLSEL